MFALLLFITSQILVTFGASNKAGRVQLYDLIKIEACDYKNELDSSLSFEIRKNGDSKNVAGKFKLPIDFDNTFKVNFRADRWTGSEWKIDYFKQSGLACDLLQKLTPKVFDTVVSKLEPKVLLTKCNIPKNTYTFDNVEATADEINIPSLMYSKYRTKAIITTHDNKEIACISTEVYAKE